MAAHLYVRPQDRAMECGTVELYLKCNNCLLSSPQLGDWFFNASVGFRQIIHTSHAEIVYANIRLWPKQQLNDVHLPLSCSICKIYVGAIFSANMRQNVITPRAGIPPDFAWRRSWHCCIWDCLPGPFQIMQRCVANVASKVCQLEWLHEPISACATC